jgi:hypothetical protein
MSHTTGDNWNCDGSGPHVANGEVRILPLDGGANAILCGRCFTREIKWRRLRNITLVGDQKFDLPKWKTLQIYTP